MPAVQPCGQLGGGLRLLCPEPSLAQGGLGVAVRLGQLLEDVCFDVDEGGSEVDDDLGSDTLALVDQCQQKVPATDVQRRRVSAATASAATVAVPSTTTIAASEETPPNVIPAFSAACISTAPATPPESRSVTNQNR